MGARHAARRPATITVGIAASTLVLLVPSAYAGHGHSLPTPDNRTHRIDRNNLTAGSSQDAVNWGIHELDRTVMNATLEGGGDVEVYDGYYGTSGIWDGVPGKATCMEYTDFYQTCLNYHVKFNLSYSADYSINKAHGLGCHELGHTVGLGHRDGDDDSNNNSCMRKIIDPQRPDFDTHDVDAVNATN